MKKRLLILMLSVVLLIGMTACAENDYHKMICEQLDNLADKSYQGVNLRVVTTMGDVQLSANYNLTQDNISYSIECFNTLPPDADVVGMSPEYKTTHTGSAKIVDGEVTEFDQEGVELPSYDELKGNFNFDASNLTNVVAQNNSLSADVISPAIFYGSEVNMQNMKIKVEYTATALGKIIITYQTDRSTVITTYEFVI